VPTYDYACDKCDNAFEEQHTIANRKVPEGKCTKCNDGDVRQVIGLTGFAYDNIKAGNSAKANKPPGWMTDKLKEIKKKQPGATMSVPF
jgi:putative FmdB family regulatory protein